MRRWLTPRIVLPLYEAVSGRRFWSQLARQRELQWRPAAELESLAIARIRQLVRHAGANVPFYRDLYRQARVDPDDLRSLEDLDSLPVVTKSALRECPRSEVVAAAVSPGRLVPCSTSGSTGTPFTFWLDRAAADHHLAGFLLGLEWAGLALWDLRVDVAVRPGRSWASRLSSSRRSALALRRWLLGQRVVQLGTAATTASELHAKLSTLPPGQDYYLRVYPSQAGRLAHQWMELGLELERLPKAVVASGENLTAANRATIGSAFRCPVVNHYSCWEALHMAQSCPDEPEIIHVNSSLAHLRVVREDGTAAEPGEAGRILLTSLTNEAMPFINYELGDRGALGEPCACGRGLPTLRKLEGRSDEVVPGRDGHFLSPIVLNQLPALGGAGDFVREFQLVETETGELVVRIVPTSRFGESQAATVRRELQEMLGDGRRISIETVTDIAREHSGKRLVIKRIAGRSDTSV